VIGGLTVIAEPGDAGLAGGSPPAAPAGGPVVALGDVAVADPPAVRWLDRPPRSGDAPDQRVIAPSGDGLWRSAPWPAADALFEFGDDASGTVLLTGGDEGLRAAIAHAASSRGLDVEPIEQLTRDALAGAAVVVIAESPAGALPARAFAVLAARRVLLVPRIERTFGLEDGLDHLEFSGPDEAVTLLEAHARNPGAFARVLTWGRRKAESQRASVLFARLAADLSSDGVS